MDHRQFNTHSFRIGAATSAKHARVSDSHLKKKLLAGGKAMPTLNMCGCHQRIWLDCQSLWHLLNLNLFNIWCLRTFLKVCKNAIYRKPCMLENLCV